MQIMNDEIRIFLAGDNFISEMQLQQRATRDKSGFITVRADQLLKRKKVH